MYSCIPFENRGDGVLIISIKKDPAVIKQTWYRGVYCIDAYRRGAVSKGKQIQSVTRGGTIKRTFNTRERAARPTSLKIQQRPRNLRVLGLNQSVQTAGIFKRKRSPIYRNTNWSVGLEDAVLLSIRCFCKLKPFNGSLYFEMWWREHVGDGDPKRQR